MLSFLIILGTSSLSCLAITIPGLSLGAAILWGMCIVLSGFYVKSTKLILIFVLNLLILYLAGGGISIYYLVAMIGIPSLIMGLLLARAKGYYELQKWGVVSAVFCVCLFIGISYYHVGSAGIITLQTEVTDYVQKIMSMSKNTELVEFYKQYGISWQEVERNFIALGKNIILHIPAIYCLQAILAIFIILYLCSLYSIKRNLPILHKKPFREEIMPWQLAWMVILGLSLWLWGRDTMSVVYYIGSNILLLMAPITIYYGLAGITYRVGKMSPKARRWTVVILIILSLVLAVSLLIFISLLGLFDSLLDYRKLRKRKEEN